MLGPKRRKKRITACCLPFSISSFSSSLSGIFFSVIDTIMAPKDTNILIPRIYKYVMLHGKGKLRFQMELRLLFS